MTARKRIRTSGGQGGGGTTIIEVPVESTGEITKNRDIFERLEDHPVPTTDQALIASQDDTHPVPVDENFIVATVVGDEVHPVPVVENLLHLSALLETHPVPTEDQAVEIALEQESHPVPQETEDLLTLSALLETHPYPIAEETSKVTGIENTTHPVPTEDQLLRISQDDTHPIPTEDQLLTFSALLENHPVPIDENTLKISQDDTHPVPTDQNSIILPVVLENHPVPTEDQLLRISQDDTHPVPVTEETLTSKVNIEESHPVPTEDQLLRISQDDTHPVSDDGDGEVYLLSMAGGNSLTNDNFDNPNNLLDLKDGAVASISSALFSSQSGSVTLDYQDLNADDLVIDQVWLRYYVRVQITLGALVTMDMEHNIGSGWVTDHTISENVISDTNHLNDYLATDITTEIAGSWANIRSLQTRVVVNMNAGLGNTASADAIEVVVVARKKYSASPTEVTLTNPDFEDNYPTSPPTGWTEDQGSVGYSSGSDKMAVSGEASVRGESATLGAIDELRQRLTLASVGSVGDFIRIEWYQRTAANLSGQGRIGFRFRDSGLALISESFPSMVQAGDIRPWFIRRTHTARIPSSTDSIDIVVQLENVSDGTITSEAVDNLRLWNLG